MQCSEKHTARRLYVEDQNLLYNQSHSQSNGQDGLNLIFSLLREVAWAPFVPCKGDWIVAWTLLAPTNWALVIQIRLIHIMEGHLIWTALFMWCSAVTLQYKLIHKWYQSVRLFFYIFNITVSHNHLSSCSVPQSFESAKPVSQPFWLHDPPFPYG